MEYFKTHQQFYNGIVLLDVHQQAHPNDVLDGFFKVYPLYQVRQHLHQLVSDALTSNSTVYTGAEERYSLLWFSRELEEALEAASLLTSPR